jgi:REP element-mobilizing transposase RayT
MTTPHRKRLKSYNTPGDAHELTFSCYRRLPLLSKDRTRRWFLEALDQARRRRNFYLWAYVIMPEHVHILLWPRDGVYEMRLIRAAIKIPVQRKLSAFFVHVDRRSSSNCEMPSPTAKYTTASGNAAAATTATSTNRRPFWL